MRNNKTMALPHDLAISESWDINELIDLFVDMNFDDIHNETLLLQFKIVAQKVGYPNEMIKRVVKLGLSEYEKLMEEIRAATPKKERMKTLKV